jgi:hypothetical protein
MANPTPETTDSTGLSSIGPLRESFLRHLAAENKSASTLLTYGKAVEQFGKFVQRSGLRPDVGDLRREHVEAFLIDLQANGWKPASVANRYRSLQQFFKWLAAEGEIKTSPMANMRPPTVPDAPPTILRPEELKALLATADGIGYDERRDTAILRLFLDSGSAAPSCRGCGVRMWTSSTKLWWCSARADARGQCRSAARLRRRWTATCAYATAAPTPRANGSGSASKDAGHRPRRASADRLRG